MPSLHSERDETSFLLWDETQTASRRAPPKTGHFATTHIWVPIIFSVFLESTVSHQRSQNTYTRGVRGENVIKNTTYGTLHVRHRKDRRLFLIFEKRAVENELVSLTLKTLILFTF